MATTDHKPRTCRVCGEPLPNGTPRVELRIAETLPRENGFTPSDATRTTIASAQICTGCAPEIIDDIEAMLDGKAIGGGVRRDAIQPSVPAARGRHRDDGRMGGAR